MWLFQEVQRFHHKQSIEATENRWEKCIELNGDYVDKWRVVYISNYKMFHQEASVETIKIIKSFSQNVLFFFVWSGASETTFL